MIDNRALHKVSQRLSLRKPQAESLQLLAEVLDLVDPSKDTDIAGALDAIRAVYPSVESFERDFPSLCFAVATGVGKTRLMGAFISYLFMTGKSRNFFVLAPNLTIYEKLLEDFRPGSAKYVFKGVEAFAHQPPLIVNAENYEEGRGVRGADLLGREAAIINIFNISKINSEVRGGNAPRIKRLQEYIGESYFEYLSGLPDLVLLMDEAHRYRGSAGYNAINELKPILGLEVTATPKTVGARPVPFRNVIYRYDLPQAMADGFVKEPAVGTRANFNPKDFDEEALERIKLEDGVHYHEHVKVALQTYARQNEVRTVHPFMLVVAQDTDHARRVRTFLESDGFFEGRYKGRVAEIHSKLTGEESDDNAQRLLNIERNADTDIVVHVNKLKEGWDVANLFTIVPLRASASDILTEQTLGRGLRLPYGKRTGVEAVDTLTVIAHDRFNDLIEKAKEADGVIHTLKQVRIGEGGDIPATAPRMVEAPSVLETMVRQTEETGSGAPATAAPRFTFSKPEELALAQTALASVLPAFQRRITKFADLNSEKVIQAVAAEALAIQSEKEGLFPTMTQDQAIAVVTELHAALVERTIAIPELIVKPRVEVSFGFRPFSLEGLESWNYQPVSRELLLQQLRTEKQTRITGDDSGEREERLEDYLVKRLIDLDEVDYQEHAALLYDLAGQVVAHFRGRLGGDEDVRNVLVSRGKDMAQAIFTQMRQHMWRTDTNYRVTLSAPFTTLRPQAFDVSGADAIRDFRQPPPKLSEIKRYVFNGFKRGCYWQAKFDSDTERQMAVLLERDDDVHLWMKPGPGQFKIYDADGGAYQPDFVVETAREKLIIETKRKSELEDLDVRRKAKAAVLWCMIATKHAATQNEKPWRYLLVPEDAVQPNATLDGLARTFTQQPDMELAARYELEETA